MTNSRDTAHTSTGESVFLKWLIVHLSARYFLWLYNMVFNSMTLVKSLPSFLKVEMPLKSFKNKLISYLKHVLLCS